MFTLLAAIICTITVATAQQNSKTNNPTWVRNQKALAKIQKLSNASAKKTRAADQRLIGEVYEDISDLDSTTYSYTASRGSILDTEFGIFFEDHNYTNSNRYSSTNTPPLYYKSSRTYDGNNLVLVALDSVNFGSSWSVYRATNTYNSTNQLASSLRENLIGTTWEKSGKTDYTYAGNNLTLELSQSWNTVTSMWENSSKTEYIYVGNNLTETTYFYWLGVVWQGVYKTNTTYNTNNKPTVEIAQNYDLTTSTWENSNRSTYTYNTANQPTNLLSESWDGTAWENDYRFSIVWTGSTPSSSTDETWNGTTWDKDGRTTYTYNSNNYPQNDIYESWDPNTSTYSYDPNNGDYTDRYYYEAYNNNVSTKDVAATFGTVKIYPNPTTNFVTVAVTKNTNTANVMLTDLTGKVISTTAIRAGENTVNVGLAGLATGVYFVKITDANGVTFTQKVSKN